MDRERMVAQLWRSGVGAAKSFDTLDGTSAAELRESKTRYGLPGTKLVYAGSHFGCWRVRRQDSRLEAVIEDVAEKTERKLWSLDGFTSLFICSYVYVNKLYLLKSSTEWEGETRAWETGNQWEVSNREATVWVDVSSVAFNSAIVVKGDIIEDASWLRSEASSHINIASWTRW